MIGRLAEEVFAGGREEWRGRREIGDAVERFETKALTKMGQSIWIDVQEHRQHEHAATAVAARWPPALT